MNFLTNSEKSTHRLTKIAIGLKNQKIVQEKCNENMFEKK